MRGQGMMQGGGGAGCSCFGTGGVSFVELGHEREWAWSTSQICIDELLVVVSKLQVGGGGERERVLEFEVEVGGPCSR